MSAAAGSALIVGGGGFALEGSSPKGWVVSAVVAFTSSVPTRESETEATGSTSDIAGCADGDWAEKKKAVRINTQSKSLKPKAESPKGAGRGILAFWLWAFPRMYSGVPQGWNLSALFIDISCSKFVTERPTIGPRNTRKYAKGVGISCVSRVSRAKSVCSVCSVAIGNWKSLSLNHPLSYDDRLVGGFLSVCVLIVLPAHSQILFPGRVVVLKLCIVDVG